MGTDFSSSAGADGTGDVAGTPRWVKVFGVVALVVVLLVAAVALAGGGAGGHGPGRHLPPTGAAEPAP